MNNSPLGQYAPLVATVAALGIIGAYLFSLLFGATFSIPATSTQNLQTLALIAVGAVFGSAVSVNGWKQPLSAAHNRLDTLEKEVAVTTAAVGVNTEAIHNINESRYI